jgi:hypothetical protein
MISLLHIFMAMSFISGVATLLRVKNDFGSHINPVQKWVGKVGRLGSLITLTTDFIAHEKQGIQLNQLKYG